jgi:hypothetical protein
MRVLSSLALGSSISTSVLAFGSSPCYIPNGTDLNSLGNSEIKQCSSGVSTMCCSLNRINPPGNESSEMGWTQDECLPNGLCQNRYLSHGVPYASWWVEACTNPDPSSSDCLDVCRGKRDRGGGALLTPCGVAGTEAITPWMIPGTLHVGVAATIMHAAPMTTRSSSYRESLLDA